MSLWKQYKSLLTLHRFSRNVLWGTTQLTLIVITLAAALKQAAPQLPSYARGVACYTALAEIAPAVWAAGVIAALICDLALRPRS